MKNTSIFVGIVILIILIGAGVILSKNRSTGSSPYSYASPTVSPNSTASAPASQYLVTYTDSGFSPKTLTVPLGGTVQFKNGASDAVWVASNPHPTHTDYPGFDAKRNYAPGETYSFTFTKKGNWGYHNHLNPSEGGTIVVQ